MLSLECILIFIRYFLQRKGIANDAAGIINIVANNIKFDEVVAIMTQLYKL